MRLPPEAIDGSVIVLGNNVRVIGSFEHHGFCDDLEPGLYQGDVIITGDHVTIVGPDYYGCRRGGRAVLLGDLIIEGDHARVVNLEVEGQTLVFGAHNRIYQSCELYGWDEDD